MKYNMMASFGRISYSTHMMLYPIIGGSLWFVYKQYSTASAEAAKQATWDALPKASVVDPDYFNPFSAIPYHNNQEVHYRYAKNRMHNYVDPKTHINTADYAFRGFHDSYDHGNKKTHLYNWANMYPADKV